MPHNLPTDISSDLSLDQARQLTREALHGADDGELFIEKRQTESSALMMAS